MKKLLPLLFVLFATVSFGQVDIVPGPPKPLVGDPSSVDIKYDKFKDYTFINSKKTSLSATGRFAALYPDATFDVGTGFTGTKAPGDVSFFLHFTFRARDWRFIGRDNELLVIADTARFSLGKGSRDGDVSSSRNSVSVVERLLYSATRKQFETMANATSVEIQIGGFESAFYSENKVQFLNVIAALPK